MAAFIHHDLRLLDPRLSSPLLDVITDLDYLRRLEMEGTTPYSVFAQLKGVFHFLESLASARIEGNHTTLADYVESKVVPNENPSEELRDI
jgi:Fic family protein